MKQWRILDQKGLMQLVLFATCLIHNIGKTLSIQQLRLLVCCTIFRIVLLCDPCAVSCTDVVLNKSCLIILMVEIWTY
jgi:hypothetical protein